MFQCVSLSEMCKRDPPEISPPETYPDMLREYEQQYILAGPIYLQNYTDVENNVTDGSPCNDVINTPPPRG